MDFEKISDELGENENSQNGTADRYNTKYLVADLKDSNKTPKIIVGVILAVILIGAALFYFSNNSDTADNGQANQAATTVSKSVSDAATTAGE